MTTVSWPAVPPTLDWTHASALGRHGASVQYDWPWAGWRWRLGASLGGVRASRAPEEDAMTADELVRFLDRITIAGPTTWSATSTSSSTKHDDAASRAPPSTEPCGKLARSLPWGPSRPARRAARGLPAEDSARLRRRLRPQQLDPADPLPRRREASARQQRFRVRASRRRARPQGGPLCRQRGRGNNVPASAPSSRRARPMASTPSTTSAPSSYASAGRVRATSELAVTLDATRPLVPTAACRENKDAGYYASSA
jgi:hypothetical protein